MIFYRYKHTNLTVKFLFQTAFTVLEGNVDPKAAHENTKTDISCFLQSANYIITSINIHTVKEKVNV